MQDVEAERGYRESELFRFVEKSLLQGLVFQLHLAADAHLHAVEADLFRQRDRFDLRDQSQIPIGRADFELHAFLRSVCDELFMRERGYGRRRAGLQKAASGDCHRVDSPCIMVAIWLRCGFSVDIAAHSVCQTPLNCQYLGPEGSKIEYRLGHSSLGARDLRMERDYNVIVLRDLAQRRFHVVVNGRGDRYPRLGVEVSHRGYAGLLIMKAT